MSQEPDRIEVATELIDGRISVYGDPVDTFVRIAQMWSAILGHTVQPYEVPLMMAAMKMVRATQAPDYSDNVDDVEGYMDIYRKLLGSDMIHARSVSEYLAERNRRSNQVSAHPFEPSDRVPTVCRWCNRMEKHHV